MKFKVVKNPIEHEALCLANELLDSVAHLVANPTAKGIRHVSNELDGWASTRAERAEKGEMIENELTSYNPVRRRLELIEAILDARYAD